MTYVPLHQVIARAFKYNKELAARREIEFVGSGRLSGGNWGRRSQGQEWYLVVVFDWEIAMLIQPSRSFVGDDSKAGWYMRGVFASLSNETPTKRCHMSQKHTYEETVWV